MRRFRTQLMFISILVTLCSVLATTELVSMCFTDALWKQDSTAMSKQFELVEKQLGNMFEDAQHSLAVVQQLDSVQRFFLGEDRPRKQAILLSNTMLREISTTLNKLRTISGVIFIHGKDMYGVTPRWNFNRAELPAPLRDTLAASSGTYPMRWLGARCLQDFISTPLSDTSLGAQRYLVGVSRTRYSTVSRSTDVTVLTLIAVDDIDAILSQIGMSESEVLLVDADGDILAGRVAVGTGASAGTRIPAQLLAEHTTSPTGHGEFEYSTEAGGYRLFYNHMHARDWFIICRMSLHTYQRQTNELRLNSYFIGACAILAMVGIYFLLTRAFLRPFSQVMGLFRQVRAGNLAARLRPFKQALMPVADELETMRVQLNSMLDSIEALLADTQRANQERTQMELYALQNQLNPHMIFNTLTSIRWMVMLQRDNWPGSENVDAMLVEFASLLQPMFDESQSEWTLREELDYIAHYTALLRMRYCAEFTLAGDISPAMYATPIPRFILQPVLENSCEHGMTGARTIHIELRAQVEAEFLCVTISDDGRGMTAEQLALLQARLAGVSQPTDTGARRRSIGLINVHRQLQMHFGPGSGVRIDTRDGQGTRVTLKMHCRPSADAPDSAGWQPPASAD